VVMTSAYNGRIFAAVNQEKKPFNIIWDGQVWAIDMWGIPKGTPNLENTLAFLKFATSTEHSSEISRYIAYSSPRKSAVPLISTHAETGIDMKPHLPTAPDNFKNALRNNVEFYTDHQEELDGRFNAWLLQ
jgi:putative spermidine/putrescine transport system substrate-binding protein